MEKRQLPEDFLDFLDLLNSNNVKYLLLGGWAVGIYGHPRATKDIDFLINTDDENLIKLSKALYEFGAPTVDMSNFKIKKYVFRMGRSPVQIDIINSADGIDFNKCFPNKNVIDINGIKVSVISKKDLIKNKTASGRTQDLADVEKLK